MVLALYKSSRYTKQLGFPAFLSLRLKEQRLQEITNNTVIAIASINIVLFYLSYYLYNYYTTLFSSCQEK